MSEGGVGKADVPIRRARSGVPQERVTPKARRRSEKGRSLEPRARRTSGRPIHSILESQPWEVLEPLLPPAIPAAEAIARLKRYGELLLEWNRNVSNLISRHDEVRLVPRHLRESLAPARWMSESNCRQWLDLGSGAGLPAIPLAIAGVGDRWTLVESRRTKTLFLRKVIEELGLERIDVVLGRLETLIESGQLGQDFDGFTSRATMTLGPTLELAGNIVKNGGCAFLWKGSRRGEEMSTEAQWRSVWKWLEEREAGESMASVIRFEKLD